jgi:hypothetical protein
MMMKKLKMFGVFGVGLLVCSLFVSIGCGGVGVVNAEGFSTSDKVHTLLGDVLGLDTSKYRVEGEGYRVRYEFGFEVEEGYFVLVDENGGLVGVRASFYNGYPRLIHITPRNGSLYYAVEPPKGSVGAMKAVFERYADFAQTYGISTIDKATAFNLIDKTPRIVPKNYLSATKVSSDSLIFHVSQEGFSFGYNSDGVEAIYKSWEIAFTDKLIEFSDTFGLYSVYGSGIYSKKQVTDLMFDLAVAYADSFFAESDVKPDWSKMRSEVSFGTVSGQMDNNVLNNLFLESGVGNVYGVERDAAVLYPFWSAQFYFKESIGNIAGIQVGVWGDNGQVSYCYEIGYLGSSGGGGYSSNGPSSFGSEFYVNPLVFAAIVVIGLCCVIGVVAIFGWKKHLRVRDKKF